MLCLPAELLLTTQVAIHWRSSVLKIDGDKSDYSLKLDKIDRCIDKYNDDMHLIWGWTDDQRMNTAKTMLQYGGHFAQSIANAYFNGDSHNQGRVVAAFPDMFLKYGPGGAFYEEA
jgi:hypothetical protein